MRPAIVGELRLICRREEDIVRVERAVSNGVAVQVLQRRGDLMQDSQQWLAPGRPLDLLKKCPPSEVKLAETRCKC